MRTVKNDGRGAQMEGGRNCFQLAKTNMRLKTN